ncbi:hypothetical protein LINPERHAP2_LOCUS6136 [Linum perenne]
MSTAAEIYEKVKLKLLINNKTNKVIFAEAGKDFVDVHFSILSFPLQTIIKPTFKDQNQQGCLGNLYHSVESLSNNFFRYYHTKDSIMNPETRLYFGGKTLYQKGDKFSAAATRKVYSCSNQCRDHVAYDPHTICYYCRGTMSGLINITSPYKGECGIVKGASGYMVMDNLEVQPISAYVYMNSLSTLNIQQADVEERIIQIRLDKVITQVESLILLEASLQSKTVLTKVFLEA